AAHASIVGRATYGSRTPPTRASVIRTLALRFLLLVALAAAYLTAEPRRSGADDAPDSTTLAWPLVPHIALPQGPLAASEDFLWNIRVRVVNPLERSIYVDSLALDITDLYVASRHRGQTQSFNVTKVTEILKGVAPNDSGFMSYSGPAFSERARVTMRLHYHMGDGRSFLTPPAAVEMSPSLVSISHSPLFLTTKKGKIEYSLVPELWPDRPSPAILLIHGEDGQARDWLPLAWNLASHGYYCMLMSLPGYGFSEGPPDFAGPRSGEAAGPLADPLRPIKPGDSDPVA